MKQGLVDSLKVSLVVGTLLCVINQWDAISEFCFERGMLLSVVLNYVIPFAVASYSKFQVHGQNEKREKL